MSEKIRAVLAGCGSISNAWLGSEAMKAGAEIVGLVDLNLEAARAKAEEHGWAHAAIGTDLARMLDDTRPEVVFDCTVPSAHINVTLEALRHGCHVLGEKPLADTLEHAREMVAAAQQAGKLYVVMQNRRYDATIRRLRAFLDSGAIGKLTTVQSNFFVGIDFGRENFRTHMRHVLILDMAIHTFDAARFLMGATPLSVYCHEWNPSGSWYDCDASALAHFEMSDGVTYTYQGSWCPRGMNTTWEADWRIIGDEGSVLWDGADGYRAERLGDDGKCHAIPVPEFDAGIKVGGHNGLIADFLACVRSGQTPETRASDNIHSLEMVLGAIASSEQERKIVFTSEGAFV